MTNIPNHWSRDKGGDQNSEPLPWEFNGPVPEGDHPDVTQHLTESTVAKLTTAMREIVDMVGIHEAMAPTTATSVWDLLAATSHELLAWVRRWQA